MTFTAEDIKKEYRLFNMHQYADKWGECMGLWFDIAAELHFRNPSAVPGEWEYSPGAAYDDPREPDGQWFDMLKQVATDELQKLGDIFNRYSDKLRLAGESY